MRRSATRKALAAAVLTAAALAGCRAEVAPTPTPRPTSLTAGTGDAAVALTQISEGVWLHLTYADYQGARVPSNGLVVLTSAGPVLIDTPWTPEQTATLDRLLADEFGAGVVAAVVTHAHPDRMGGAPYLREADVPITSLQVVANRAEATGYVVPDDVRPGDLAELTIGGVELEVFFPGAGHTVDNTVVWLPESGVLFAGCLVKEAAAIGLGNLDDAVVADWPEALRALQERYPGAVVVIPGHGPTGGRELIEHTLDLITR